jgi:ABC-2 type transport system permease protein/oleandomycin transport system permease protein
MTTTELTAGRIARRHTVFIGPVLDSFAVAQRNLIALKRVPQLIVFSTIQPVIFVLMFRYVFGGAIDIPGIPYVDYLMPGIFVQTVVFGSMGSAIGLAADLKSGLLERFRSMPMARSAVLAGRTLADLARNVFVMALMVAVGYAVGFRAHLGALKFLAGIGVVLIFAYTLSWVFASLGLAVGDPETAQAAAFPLMAPLVFASSAFVSVQSMPGWLQAFASHQPVSLTACTARSLMLPAEVVEPLCGSLGTNLAQAFAWYAGILIVFAPLAVRKYRRSI